MQNNIIKIFTDGGARGNPGPGASAFVVYSDNLILIKESRYLGLTTNNFAEYNAVLDAIKWLGKNKNLIKSKKVNFFIDSELVVKQLSGEYKIKNEKLKKVFIEIQTKEKVLGFDTSYTHIFRINNKLADKLVNEELDRNIPLSR